MSRTDPGGAPARELRVRARCGDRVAVIMLKGRPEYRDWINELSGLPIES
jgi:hypothetical protein